MRNVLGIALVVAVLAPGVVITLAQNQPLKFEVAAIHATDPGNAGCQYFWPDPSRFRTINATLKCLVRAAYEVNDYQIRGAEGWMDSMGYDILATAQASAADRKQRQAMIQQLLAQRFHLQFHSETRDMPSYTLTVAKRGHKMKEAAAAGIGVSAGPGRTQGRGADMATLASVLAIHLERPVQDATGLHGYYDFSMTWSPLGAQNNNSAPDLLTALQEQLGLKLESSRSQTQMIFIDHAEKPDAN